MWSRDEQRAGGAPANMGGAFCRALVMSDLISSSSRVMSTTTGDTFARTAGLDAAVPARAHSAHKACPSAHCAKKKQAGLVLREPHLPSFLSRTCAQANGVMRMHQWPRAPRLLAGAAG